MPHFFDARALLARVGSTTPTFEVHVKLAGKPEPERRRPLVSRPQTPAPRPPSREAANLGAHHEKLGTWMDGHAWLDSAHAPEQGERRRERRLQDAARRARERERVERLKEREEERRRDMQRREEMRRAELRRRIDEERQKADERRKEERRKVEERRRAERVRAERRRRQEREARVGEAWRVYEARWAALGASAGADDGRPLAFGNVPWPVLETPAQAEDIRPDAVQRFLLSSAHSADVQRRERIRRALRRWHPDKFSRVVDMVEEGEREKVMAGAAVVIRCLNEMLETENQVALAA